MLYDAAGRQITTIEFGQFSTINYSSGYDGDGQIVYESSNASGVTETSYIVRSTVLGGEVLTRLNQSGNKKITHVPAEGLLFATQRTEGGAHVLQTYRNPLGTTETNKAVYDPLGNYIPYQAFADPRPPAGSYSSASFGGLSGTLANPHAYGTGCMLDGLPTNCNLTSRMQNNGSAVQCRNNDCGPQAVRVPMRDGSLFSFLSTPYMAFGNNISRYFLPGWAEAGTPQAQADVIEAWIFGGRTGIDSRAGLTSNNFLPQQSTCADFIDKMLNIVQGPGSIIQANSGRLLARWAAGALRKQAINNPNVVPSGFQAKYVQGGQNLFAPVHIAGVAGGILIGDNWLDPRPGGNVTGPGGSRTGTEMVKAQFAQDNAQLQWGLSRQKMGFTKTGDGGQPIPGYSADHALTKFIAEKHAELWDDGAGVSVGRTLERLLNDKNFNRRDARNEIFGLLCDR